MPCCLVRHGEVLRNELAAALVLGCKLDPISKDEAAEDDPSSPNALSLLA
jgi:hypothetical protein